MSASLITCSAFLTIHRRVIVNPNIKTLTSIAVTCSAEPKEIVVSYKNRRPATSDPTTETDVPLPVFGGGGASSSSP